MTFQDADLKDIGFADLGEGSRQAVEEVDAGSGRGLAGGLVVEVREGAHGKVFECCILVCRNSLRGGRMKSQGCRRFDLRRNG